MHRLVTPTARIFAAIVIMITGTGVSAVFWKMPCNGEFHALYHEGVVDKNLPDVPLPSEAIAAISLDEMQRMELPILEYAPVADDGVGKYAQVYAPPASLAMLNAEREKIPLLTEEEEPFKPIIPQKFEPMRQIVDEQPVSVESVSRDFPPKPMGISTAERSDEMITLFHFAENSRANFESETEPVQPMDPFPIAATSAPALQPLKPLLFENLSPLLPLQESELHPRPTQIPQ